MISFITEILGNKRWPHTVVICGIVIWASWKVFSEVVTVRDNIVREFAHVREQIMVAENRLNKRMDTIEEREKRAWSVDMQVIRDSLIVARNTNVWVPDSYRIYEAIRNGKAPEAVRITQ